MAQAKAKSSQDFVPIQEIRSGVVVLKDRSMRAVLLASSLNFALKSQDEQEAIVLQFQNFLNSLEFPIQIFVESRDLDIRPYIALLEERYVAQTSDLMKIQTREYIEFIKRFVENVNIMSKRFFVVVPYSAATIKGTEGVKGIFGKVRGGDKKTGAQNRIEAFEESRSQLEQRLSVVEQGLGGAGIRVVRLGTEELVELYYKIFNPGELGKPIPPGTQQ
ncbi:conjugal transfer protein TraC [Candidatus Wolfebacteria bacterium]|nr:conjugal transfer protein TraC [Candidatus Wolfebacteria bacterium]